FGSAKAHVTSTGIAQVKVTSVGPPDEVAAGRLTLELHKKVVGAVAYSLAVGRHKTLTVRLNKARRQALTGASGNLKVIASAETTGAVKPLTKTLRLEA